ncbi:cytochrome b/b6 domain-containing protein [Nocardioides cynanchi]|uniref:cytochrome b/b6 domain-containing protein n=1 Tax=Nocardioides cynanchi TaxID=2558918 RepID=UPI00177C4B7E|nr:cytochrome b/b6 domain-containing protein [Nocardioides cynanchi]
MSSRAAQAPSTPVDHTALRGEEWVHRFGLTERFAHWWTVSLVATALLTGLALGDDAEGGPMLTAHVGAVVLIGVGLVLALVLGNTRALLTATYHLFTVDRRDAAWVRAHLPGAAKRHEPDEWGMFNPGQKVLAWALSLAVTAVVVTGIQAWQAGEGEGSLHGAAVLVAMVLLGCHVFMAVVNPSTRPALAGMVLGRVRRSWAEQHHGGWLHDRELARKQPRR